MTDTTHDKRLALVTGASRGIGYGIALALAAQGIHVIATARTVGGLEELDDEIRALGGSATLVPLDLKDFDAIDQLGASLYERWGKLDILVANAGLLGDLSPLGHADPKNFEETFQVNVTASWRLIRSMDPLLQQSDAGRVVLVSSGAAYKNKSFWGTYSASKAALESLMQTYANETTHTALKVNSFSPGPTRTAMRARAMPGEDPQSLPAAKDVAKSVLPMISVECDHSGHIYDHEGQCWLKAQIPVQVD